MAVYFESLPPGICTSGIHLFVKELLSGVCQMYIPDMEQEYAHAPAWQEGKQPGCSNLQFAKKKLVIRK